MIERHYAHFSKGYLADSVKTVFGKMGIVEDMIGIPDTISRDRDCDSMTSAQYWPSLPTTLRSLGPGVNPN